MPTPTPDRLAPGRSYPFCAPSDGPGVTFAGFSAHARRLPLCLLHPPVGRQIAPLHVPDFTGETWRGYLP
ncbi:hypothetical protein, partial [Burkholderia pseudomallei]|uniref:hypothetical protein n=1 Tax=Burkholderia pseudomallei TaxID=28450 RepID=UPI0011AF9C8A